MSIHCNILRHPRSTSPILSERDAWIRMPAKKGACGACSTSLPCQKARATALSHRHRAARALLVSPMRIRPTKHRTSAKQDADRSYQLHRDHPTLHTPHPQEHPIDTDGGAEGIIAGLHMLELHSVQSHACEERYSSEEHTKMT